jgi:hypothetical protein
MVKFSWVVALCFAAGVTAIGWFSDATAFSRKQPAPTATSGAGATSSTSAPKADQVWVTRGDGAQSCTPGSGQSLDDGANELRKSKVRVLESRKGSDGKMHAQMCGLPSGSTNAYLIPKDDLPQAVALGYVKAQ